MEMNLKKDHGLPWISIRAKTEVGKVVIEGERLNSTDMAIGLTNLMQVTLKDTVNTEEKIKEFQYHMSKCFKITGKILGDNPTDMPLPEGFENDDLSANDPEINHYIVAAISKDGSAIRGHCGDFFRMAFATVILTVITMKDSYPARYYPRLCMELDVKEQIEKASSEFSKMGVLAELVKRKGTGGNQAAGLKQMLDLMKDQTGGGKAMGKEDAQEIVDLKPKDSEEE